MLRFFLFRSNKERKIYENIARKREGLIKTEIKVEKKGLIMISVYGEQERKNIVDSLDTFIGS